MKKYDIGVIVGRFQIPEPHNGHEHILSKVIYNSNKILIAIGVSPTLCTKNNPLDFANRKCAIEKFITERVGRRDKVIIQAIQDIPSNEEWSKNLDKLIRTVYPLGSVCIYGSRDSFIPHYSGHFDTQIIDAIVSPCATTIRESIGKTIINSEDFRAGIIYSTQNKFPMVYPTVDIAVTKIVKNKKYVLLGKKTGFSNLHFPGGFVDPTDASLEKAAIRELHEEVFNIEISNNLRYVGSFLINDWRYKDKDEKVMTTFFETDFIFGTCDPGDEFDSFEFYPINKETLNKLTENHKILFAKLMEVTCVK